MNIKGYYCHWSCLEVLHWCYRCTCTCTMYACIFDVEGYSTDNHDLCEQLHALCNSMYMYSVWYWRHFSAFSLLLSLSLLPFLPPSLPPTSLPLSLPPSLPPYLPPSLPPSLPPRATSRNFKTWIQKASWTSQTGNLRQSVHSGQMRGWRNALTWEASSRFLTQQGSKCMCVFVCMCFSVYCKCVCVCICVHTHLPQLNCYHMFKLAPTNGSFAWLVENQHCTCVHTFTCLCTLVYMYMYIHMTHVYTFVYMTCIWVCTLCIWYMCF